mmetsp:Transcript_22939/g.11086  ORF Transcript_22939/g.11086 Transcript_22939/m.11086 type:complete len:86 (-) Transcript_22939:48-305(-)
MPYHGVSVETWENEVMAFTPDLESAGLSEELLSTIKIKEVSGDCSICQENVSTGIELSCLHVFHEACLKPWLREKATCPNCRKKA